VQRCTIFRLVVLAPGKAGWFGLPPGNDGLVRASQEDGFGWEWDQIAAGHKDLDYVFGLARNSRLVGEIAAQLTGAWQTLDEAFRDRAKSRGSSSAYEKTSGNDF
jgi:hypothetical protein